MHRVMSYCTQFFHFCLLKSFSRLRSCLPGNHSTYQGSRGPVLAVACGANPKTAFLHFRETTGSDFTHEPMLCCHASSGHGHGFIFQVTIIIFNVHITLYQVAMPWPNHAYTIAYVDYVQLGGIMNNCSKYFLCLHIFYFDIFPRSGIVGPEGICLFVTQCFPSGFLSLHFTRITCRWRFQHGLGWWHYRCSVAHFKAQMNVVSTFFSFVR